MKIVGIIAEYNPFHNGHAYQIQKAKELSEADYVIVAMSGNYVQRGVPAIIDKFHRADMALQNGADLVFELPVLWSTASAEYFATAGVALFNALGCVDYLSFGCENPDLSLIASIANLLTNEPEEYSALLSSYLKTGLSFPVAREKAITHILNTDLSAFMGSPNNILALEYMKALQKTKSSIQPLPILREGAGYHALELDKDYCSASAIRNFLLNAEKQEILSSYMPKETVAYLLTNSVYYLTEQDFSQILYYKLLSEQSLGFADYADSSKDLSNKICHALVNFTDFQSFCNLLKSKDLTYTRISRLLMHILLNIKTKDYEDGKVLGYIPYLRLLGFRKEASSLIQKIKEKNLCPLITKPSRDTLLLNKSSFSMYQQDVFASNLYYGIYANKSCSTQKNEYQKPLVIVS